jgi:ABC-type transport system involved in multi-copper enzyme maturation permease subunit
MKLTKFRLNPIMVKEFRSRMRGWRAFGILTFYLVFLALFSYGVYRVTLFAGSYGTPVSPLIGQALHAAIGNLSLIFVAFLMPALTAVAISSESEKLTFEMLQATPLSPHAILIGKLVASAGYILLLIFAAVPMVSLVFTFGGVAMSDIVKAGVVIVATAVTYGIIGLFFSAWRRRTIQAIVLSYLTILLMIGGTYVIYIFWGVLIQNVPPRYILMVNPFSALASVLANNSSQNSPMMLFGLLAGWGRLIDNPGLVTELRPLWHYTLAFDLGLSLVLYAFASRFIQPIRPWRLGWRSVIIASLLAIVYLAGSTAIFYPDVKAEIELSEATPTPVPFLPPAPAIRVEPAVPAPIEAPLETTEEPTIEPDDAQTTATPAPPDAP